MYNVKRLVAGISTVLIFILVITACSQSRTSGSQKLFSKNRLANTTWEAIKTPDRRTATLTFGETSFQRRMGDGDVYAGTYTFAGDTLVTEGGLFCEGTGSLIGDVLVWRDEEFKRIK
jgi:hypothetical protein